jgi:hypothetical protein
LGPILHKSGISGNFSDFESVYDDVASSGKYPKIVKEIKNRVYEYFSHFSLPEEATLYDYLVLSLRKKDLIATFNWDPLLALAWQRNSKVAKLPKVVYLHGNVEIAICNEDRVKDFKGKSCNKCKKSLKAVPLLYPVKQKNYANNPFIKSEWIQLRYVLRHAYFFTIFGYSAPKTDVEARKVLLNEWKTNPIFELAQIEIIDIKSKKELKDNWREFFCRAHHGTFDSVWHSHIFQYPRRSCEGLAMATLQNMPWRTNCFPKTKNLRELQGWAQELWEEEQQGSFSGKDFGFS